MTTSRSLVHVRITPSDAYAQRTRLFAALEGAFPVRFVVSDSDGHDATLAFVTDLPDSDTISGPTLTLVDQTGRAGLRQPGAITFEDSELLPRPFRGRTLTESSTPVTALPPTATVRGEVLARCSDGPVWSGAEGLRHVAASWPAELASGETLREQLTAGRFMTLLPLVHFLKELSAPLSWKQPESHACFVFDDPNLHWWSYGFLDYRKVSAAAEAHGYCVTAATIPLDQWYIHRRTVELIRERGSRISFAVHGNNHTRHELRRVDDPVRAAILAAQALERIGALRRAGAEVAPVMVPPHGVCSIAMIEGCLRAGFDALCADWPYWWLEERDAVSPLSGWRPLDRFAGLPVIPRFHAVASDLDDMVFRAFLGQPLILYAHHTDLETGLDVLAARAADVRSLGVNSWKSLGDIARDVFSARRDGDTITFALYSRRVDLVIPEEVSHARFVLPGVDSSTTELRLEIGDAGGVRDVPLRERVPVEVGRLVATMTTDSAVPPQRPAWPIRPALRRVLTESRDRAAPFLSGLRRP